MLTLVYILITLIIAFITAVFYVFMMKKKLYAEHKIISKDGIDEEVVLEIGGIKQYLYIRGENVDNPIILFLHGGPGSSMVAELHAYQYLWEKNYTVVNYDQRSANMTYYLNKKNWQNIKTTISNESILQDANEVVDYILNRFKKDKIIIVGHSWGSFVGIQFAHMYPEKVETYIGVGQVINYRKSMIQLAEKAAEEIKKKNNSKDIELIKKLIEIFNSQKKLSLNDIEKLMNLNKKYMRQTKHNDMMRFLYQGIVSPYMKLRYIPYYFISDKYNEVLYDCAFNINVYNMGREYRCPIVLISGELDYGCIYDVDNFIKFIDAPYKKSIIMKDCGHVSMMDNPSEFYINMDNAINER